MNVLIHTLHICPNRKENPSVESNIIHYKWNNNLLHEVRGAASDGQRGREDARGSLIKVLAQQ